MLRTLSNIVDILTMAVSALGSISLLVGGVGIVTIMTIAVTERTGEIGLLVALGAPRNTILGLFLGEAVALSALGGLLGLLLGIGQEKARRRACADPDEAALSFGRGQPVLVDHAGIPRTARSAVRLPPVDSSSGRCTRWCRAGSAASESVSFALILIATAFTHEV